MNFHAPSLYCDVAVIPKEALSFDTHNVFGAAVTLTQPVFMGGEIKALNDIARYAEKAAVAARNTVVQNVIYTVDEAYWLVVSLKSNMIFASLSFTSTVSRSLRVATPV